MCVRSYAAVSVCWAAASVTLNVSPINSTLLSVSISPSSSAPVFCSLSFPSPPQSSSLLASDSFTPSLAFPFFFLLLALFLAGASFDSVTFSSVFSSSLFPFVLTHPPHHRIHVFLFSYFPHLLLSAQSFWVFKTTPQPNPPSQRCASSPSLRLFSCFSLSMRCSFLSPVTPSALPRMPTYVGQSK